MVLSFAHGWGGGMGSARGGAHDQICHSTDSFTFTRQHRSAPQTTLTHRHALQSPTCANEHVGTRHTETNRSPDHERQRLVLEPLRSRAPANAVTHQSTPRGPTPSGAPTQKDRSRDASGDANSSQTRARTSPSPSSTPRPPTCTRAARIIGR